MHLLLTLSVILCCVYTITDGRSLNKGHKHRLRHHHKQRLKRPLHISPGAHYIEENASQQATLFSGHTTRLGARPLNQILENPGHYLDNNPFSASAVTDLPQVAKEYLDTEALIRGKGTSTNGGLITEGHNKYGSEIAAIQQGTIQLQNALQDFKQELGTGFTGQDSFDFSPTTGSVPVYQVIKTGQDGQTRSVQITNPPFQIFGALQGQNAQLTYRAPDTGLTGQPALTGQPGLTGQPALLQTSQVLESGLADQQHAFLNQANQIVPGKQVFGTGFTGMMLNQPSQILPVNQVPLTGLSPQYLASNDAANDAMAFSVNIDGYKSSFIKNDGDSSVNFNADDTQVMLTKKTNVRKNGQTKDTGKPSTRTS